MFKAFASHVVTKDETKALKKRLEDLNMYNVFVGVPDESNREEGNITNAQLLFILEHGVRDKTMRDDMKHNLDSGMKYSRAYEMYIHEHGSPLWQIPPRPVLIPAVESVKDRIAKYFQSAIKAAIEGKDPFPFLLNASESGQKAAFRWFTNPNNGWAPNAPSTIKMKQKKNSREVVRPMIDTGALRRSILGIVYKGETEIGRTAPIEDKANSKGGQTS